MPALSALLDEPLLSHMCTTTPVVARRWHQEMPAYHSSALRTQRMAALNTTAALLLAALASIRAAPLLLRHRPASDPVREARIAVIRSRSGGGLGHAAVALARAALAMVRAAPCLLLDGPAQLPIREAISAVVRVGWGRRRGLLTADVMIGAAPRLLRRHPAGVLPDCAIEGISRRRRGGRQGRWQWQRHCWRRCWRRRWRGCGRRSRLRSCCWLLCAWAPEACGGTAELLLLLRPEWHTRSHPAVKHLCGSHP